MVERPVLIRPGEFGVAAAADTRRGVFDYHNEALLAARVPIDAVFIGDSITDMWALDAFFLGTHGCIVNRGIGGDRTPFVLRRFHADVVQLRPRLVVIKIGVNNTWDLDPSDPFYRRGEREIEEEIVADIASMLARAREAGIQTALCSILPTNSPFNGNRAVRNKLIARANARLKQLAGERNVLFVDYHRHLVMEDGLTLRPELADDGLHPHVACYEIMADVLIEALTGASVDVITRRPSYE